MLLFDTDIYLSVFDNARRSYIHRLYVFGKYLHSLLNRNAELIETNSYFPSWRDWFDARN